MIKNMKPSKRVEDVKVCNTCKKSFDKTHCVWSTQFGGHISRCLGCERERSRKYYEENKERFARRDAKLTEKRKARNKIKNLIARGVVTRKPCEVCGESETHAHHDDYSKPLDVRFLCPRHHAEIHRTANTEGEHDTINKGNKGDD